MFKTYTILNDRKISTVTNLPIFGYKEEEKFVLGEGQCFGEWGLIYKKDRTASAYALETTDLFMLDSSSFETSFSVKLIF